jgi:hypothetical protein
MQIRGWSSPSMLSRGWRESTGWRAARARRPRRGKEGGASSLSSSGGKARLNPILSNPRHQELELVLDTHAQLACSSRPAPNRAGTAPTKHQIPLVRRVHPCRITLHACLSAASRAHTRLHARLAPPRPCTRLAPAHPHRRGVVPSLRAYSHGSERSPPPNFSRGFLRRCLETRCFHSIWSAWIASVLCEGTGS